MLHSRTIHGVIRLTRYQDYLLSVIATTLLGVMFSGTEISYDTLIGLILVTTANILSVSFTFMINDIEDAHDDARDPDKAKRNPISDGYLRKRNAYAATMLVALATIALYYFLRPVVFWLGTATLVIGTLYSWRWVRLKSMPVLDLISHGLMLAGLQFATAYFTFSSSSWFSISFILPFFLVVCVSMYGELFNEVRDYRYDQLAGLNHTASFIGKKNASVLMYLFLLIAGATILLGVTLNLVSLWFLGLSGVIGALFLIPPLLEAIKKNNFKETEKLYNPVQAVTIISVIIWLLIQSLS